MLRYFLHFRKPLTGGQVCRRSNEDNLNTCKSIPVGSQYCFLKIHAVRPCFDASKNRNVNKVGHFGGSLTLLLQQIFQSCVLW